MREDGTNMLACPRSSANLGEHVLGALIPGYAAGEIKNREHGLHG